MKRLLALFLILILILTCITACDLFKKDKGVTCERYENCAVFTFNDFSIGETASFELARTDLGEGAIHYQVNLKEGALSVSYKDTGLIHNEQLLGEFTADDKASVNGSVGYIEGNKITIIFESLSAVSGEIIIAFTEDALEAVCGESKCLGHTYEYSHDETGHGWSYTCGCKTPPNFAQHVDGDGDGRCDESFCCYLISSYSSNVAQIVLDREQELIDEINRLHSEHPQYRFYYNPVKTVYCTLILYSDASADEMVEKYDMVNVFANAEVSALNAIKMISINFDRNDFTEDVHQEIKLICENEALIKNLFIEISQDWTRSYMPRIEYHTDNAVVLEYESISGGVNLISDKSFIIKSKAEYDAYLDEQSKAAEYDYQRECVDRYRGLYNEEFFDKNALIITKEVVRGSGSIKLTVDNLYVSDNTLYVVIRTDEPTWGTADMQYAIFAFAVDKNKVVNVDEVITLE